MTKTIMLALAFMLVFGLPACNVFFADILVGTGLDTPRVPNVIGYDKAGGETA